MKIFVSLIVGWTCAAFCAYFHQNMLTIVLAGFTPTFVIMSAWSVFQ